MKKISKIVKPILIILAFALCYQMIMVFAINYLYEYPNYQLDEWERAKGARLYRIVYKTKIDNNTTIYFSRSKNGVGSDLHFGTVDSDAIHLNQYVSLANFLCEQTSDFYTTTDVLGVVKTTDSSHKTILFGSTLNENTSKVIARFYTSEEDNNPTEIELEYNEQCYYYIGYDESLNDCTYRLIYLNDDDELVLSFEGQVLTESSK